VPKHPKFDVGQVVYTNDGRFLKIAERRFCAHKVWSYRMTFGENWWHEKELRPLTEKEYGADWHRL